jgi:hypothetical protein
MNPFISMLVNKYAIAGGLLLLLVLVDLITGLGSAAKRGTFHWSQIANTYRTTILPVVLGWMGVSILAEGLALGLQAALTPEVAAVTAPLLAGLTPAIFYGLAVFRLINSIYNNTREIMTGVVSPPTPFLPGGPVENRTNQPLP